ncbi:hypothetical protein G4177_26845 [Corallococcus sp. ZKHCc1 1396]|uniref:Uncharacterized protein n=1 Tax=Corallococcus soli TaxID=2710757 RepID=A0ABR9PV34_9BACT|nr:MULTISPECIES: hypothetical protein [Corallococcus]MBE4751793.1 hypothetical protein [Corallococcus soli]MCY1033453.1 hypothetical protein [Corallococcus sp. BB11-1]RYZ47110.1 MAG: hypothetical protein EOO72_00320 [Myxococcaceae bacterium]
MDLDTWVRGLVADCSRKEPRFKQLNAWYAIGLPPALAKAEGAPENPRQELDDMWPFSCPDYENPLPTPDIYLPQTCGQLANWLCGMMLKSFETDMSKQKQVTPSSIMSDFELVKFRLQSRSERHHHLLRVDSKPLGHSYVLYLPPGKTNGDYVYHHYQNNCNEAMPFLTLNEWLASPRSRKRGDPCEHINKLREIRWFIGLSQREWIFQTFTLLDTAKVRTFASGKYHDPLGDKPRTLKMGGVDHSTQGQDFMLFRLDPRDFHKNLVDFYGMSGVGAEAARFNLEDLGR